MRRQFMISDILMCVPSSRFSLPWFEYVITLSVRCQFPPVLFLLEGFLFLIIYFVCTSPIGGCNVRTPRCLNIALKFRVKLSDLLTYFNLSEARRTILNSERTNVSGLQELSIQGETIKVLKTRGEKSNIEEEASGNIA